MNYLLCLLALTTADTTHLRAERVGNTLIVSLPQLKLTEKYTEIWFEPTPSSEAVWLSRSSFKIASRDTRGTFEVAVCGPGYCRIDKFAWTAESPPPSPILDWFRDLTVWGWLGAIIVVGFTIWGIGKAIKPNWN